MANKKISELPALTTVAGTETIPVVQGGVTKQATILQLLSLVLAGSDSGLDTFFEVATRFGLDEATVATLQALVASKATPADIAAAIDELAASVSASYPTLDSGRLKVAGSTLAPSAIGAEVAGAAAALQAGQGATIGATALDVAGRLTVSVTTPWGIRSDGTPYYEPSGARLTEQAVLDINPTNGAPRLTKIAS